MNEMGQSPSQYGGTAVTTPTGAANSSSMSTTSTLTRHRTLLRSPFVRRRSKKRLELSAAFAVPPSPNVETLNINTATVEQLMTLPGINRLRAETIVDHRNAIGGRFLKVDDLALVSGIGAEKLEIIRPEICVKRLPASLNGSSVSSRTPSLDSILTEPMIKEMKNVNINTATIFQLQQIPGINQELAAKIIDYRNKKGNFHSLDHLVKVKGLSTPRLGAIKSYLSIDDEDLDISSSLKGKGKKSRLQRHSSSTFYTSTTTTAAARSGLTSSTPTTKTRSVTGQETDETITKKSNGLVGNGTSNSHHRKSLSVPIKMNLNLTNGFKSAPINDIYDLLSVYSQRPIIEDNLRLDKNNSDNIRIASWNLDKMTYAKSENLGVKEVFCRTILENKLSIICLQEVLDPKSLLNICNELNFPKLKRIVEWRNNSHQWKYICNTSCHSKNMMNGLGFIYDSSIWDLNEHDIIDMEIDEQSESSSIVANNNDRKGGIKTTTNPTVFVCNFVMNNWKCSIMNIYLKYYNLNDIDQLVMKLKKSVNLNDIYLVVGDFSGLTTNISEYLNSSNINLLNNIGYYNLFPINSTLLSHDDGDESRNDIDNDKNIILNELNNNNILSSCNIMCRENWNKINTNKNNNDNNISNELHYVPNNSNNSCNITNISDKRLTNMNGIIKNGLHHMAIPRNWNWGGPISDYLPIWIEIYRDIPSVSREVTTSKSTATVTSSAITPTLNSKRLSIFNKKNDDLGDKKLTQNTLTHSSQSLSSIPLTNNTGNNNNISNLSKLNAILMDNNKDKLTGSTHDVRNISSTSSHTIANGKILTHRHSVEIDSIVGKHESSDSVFLKS